MDALQLRVSALRNALRDKGYLKAEVRLDITGDAITIWLRTGGEKALPDNFGFPPTDFTWRDGKTVEEAFALVEQLIDETPESVTQGYAKEFA